MRLVLDAGAFLAVERGDRDVVALLKGELVARRAPVTHGAVVGQIWRGGTGRQANVARLLGGVEVVAVDDRLGKRAGLLMKRARTTDVVDAALVLLAGDGDMILTSDTEDIALLAGAGTVHVDVLQV